MPITFETCNNKDNGTWRGLAESRSDIDDMISADDVTERQPSVISCHSLHVSVLSTCYINYSWAWATLFVISVESLLLVWKYAHFDYHQCKAQTTKPVLCCNCHGHFDCVTVYFQHSQNGRHGDIQEAANNCTIHQCLTVGRMQLQLNNSVILLIQSMAM